MEELELNITQDTAGSKPAIYSAKVIYIFAVLFSVLFGGIMLMMNLKSIGKTKAAYIVLVISAVYTVATIVFLNMLEKPGTLTYAINFIGAAILTEKFFKPNFIDPDSYPKRKIWVPLIIGVLMTAFFVACIFLAPN